MNTILLDAQDPKTPTFAADLIRRGPAGGHSPPRPSMAWAPTG